MKTLIIDDYLESCHKFFELYPNSNSSNVYSSDTGYHDIFFVDINLGYITGDLVIQDLRKRYPDSLYVLITAEDTEVSIKNYYSEIIDEFISKHDSKESIKKRIETAYSRKKNHQNIIFEGLCFNTRTATLFLDDKILDLSFIELKILIQLMNYLEIDKSLLIRNLWGDKKIDSKTLNTHIGNINKKINPYKIRINRKKKVFIEVESL